MDKIRKPIQKRSIETKDKIAQSGFKLFCKKGYHKTNKSKIAMISCILITILLFNSFLSSFSYVRASEADISGPTDVNEDAQFLHKHEDMDSSVLIDSQNEIKENTSTSELEIIDDDTKVVEISSIEVHYTDETPVNSEKIGLNTNDDNNVQMEENNFSIDNMTTLNETVEIKEEPELSIGDDLNNLMKVQQLLTKEEGKNTFTIKNDDMKVLSVKKVWSGDEDALGLRPDQIEVGVTGPSEYYKTIILDSANDWSHKWSSAGLKPGTYTIEEIVPQHYEVSYSYEKYNLGVKEDKEEKITNGETWSFSDPELNYPNYIVVNKGNNFAVWTRMELEDNEAFLKELTERKLPANFNNMNMKNTIFIYGEVDLDSEVNLYGEGSNPGLGVSITLDGDSDGTITFKEPNYWSLLIHGQALSEEQIILTNTLLPPTLDIKGSKIWVDNEDKAGDRPESINITLKGQVENKIVYEDKKTVKADEDWSYKWENLPKFHSNDKEINYSIHEEDVPKYITNLEGYDLINTYIPDIPVAITKVVTGNFGEKVWNFDFTVTINNDDATSFNLSHDNPTYDLRGVRPGDILKLTEDAKGYEASVKVNDMTLIPNTDGSYTIDSKDLDSLSIMVTNNYDVIINTGIFMDILPYALILAFAIVALLSVFVRKNKLQNL